AGARWGVTDCCGTIPDRGDRRTARSGAAGGELVLEAQEVEEVQLAAAVAVGVRLSSAERVLEAEEIEEIEFGAAVAVGSACRGVDPGHEPGPKRVRAAGGGAGVRLADHA